MSSWLAVLKIQLHPHLEGKGGAAVSPEPEVLMPAFHGWGEAPPPSRARGRGEGRTSSQSSWLGHLVSLWDGVEQAAHPFMGPPSPLPQELPTPQTQFPPLYRGDLRGLVNTCWFFYQPLPDLGTVGIQPQPVRPARSFSCGFYDLG